ncbi:DUF559 domain-containing protein [Candidatus Uhrbacteria bacterium]|nr:DUF559 domain-containing protein [Candidatus Uhrbacteria bacterium]
MKKTRREKKTVLVAVLKSKRDRDILLHEKWYRIPVASAPKRQFRYLAFYQPACFGREGKCIHHYARVKRIERYKRHVLLPRETRAPRANDYYFQIQVSHITKLPRPIKNTTPRRISFGFTTLKRLKKSRNILELYNVAPIEKIVAHALARAGIRAIPQYQVSRYRLDFAVLSPRGNLAIECDNKKAHRTVAQRKKDRVKDRFLRHNGWRVIRIKEDIILLDIESCIARICRAMECRQMEWI